MSIAAEEQQDEYSSQQEDQAYETQRDSPDTYTDAPSQDAGRERFEEAEQLIEDDHANVRQDGPNVYKEYSGGILMQMFEQYKKLHGEPIDLSAEKLKEREIEGNRALRDLGIPTPATVQEYDDVNETEYIPGDDGSTPLDDYIVQQYEEQGEDAVYEIGARIGDYMDRMHENDIAKLDSRLAQIVKDESGWMDEDSDLVYVDNETVTTEATETDKEIEKILMLSDFKAFSSDIYQPLRRGFDDEYQQGVSRKEETLSTLRAGGSALFLQDSQTEDQRSVIHVLDNMLKGYVQQD